MICDDCALRLVNKVTNVQGIGNPWTGRCIVVPNVDGRLLNGKDASFSKQVDIIREVLSSMGDVTEECYIVPFIRCAEKLACPIDNSTIDKCIQWFAKDVEKYNFKDIILLGSSVKRFLNISIEPNLDNVFVSKNGRRYFVNYSPFIYENTDKFAIFENYLIKWYRSTIEKMYEYNLVMV
jgi:hypothetical protein